MKDLLLYMVQSIVNEKDAVKITEEVDGNATILRVIVAEGDYGKVIGKNGKVAESLRAIIRSANKNAKMKYIIKIS